MKTTMIPPVSTAKIHIDNDDVVGGNHVASMPKVSMNQTTKATKDDEAKFNDIECQHGEEELISDKDMILKSHSITHSEWIKYVFGCDYPMFTDEISKEFRMNNRSSVIPNNFGPIITIYSIQTVCRYGLPALPNGNAVVIVAFVFFIIASILFSIVIAEFFLRRMNQQIVIDRMHELSKNLPIFIEDCVLFGTTVCVGLFLIARVLTGQCPSDTSLWLTQTCNPFQDAGGIPTEQVYSLYFVPIMLLLSLKNLSYYAIAVSYIMSVTMVAFCVIFDHAWKDLWTLVYSFIFFIIAFELERLQRVAFSENMRAKDAMFQLKHDMEKDDLIRQKQLALERAADAKHIHEAEVAQLRQLMGNVAHDLKTPLFAVEADIDTLKLFFSALPETAIETASAQIREIQNLNGAEDDDVEPNTIFESLWATLRFMVAAINRGQDYMKASNGIALVPANGTFDISNAISQAARCVRPLLPQGRQLIVHPISKSLCPMIISDSHWLLENILCLVSNAIKYSDSGDVDLHVMMVDANSTEFKKFHKSTSAKSMQNPVSEQLNVSEKNVILMISIEDHGVGVPEELRATLFHPFRQAQRMTGGTGLGLFSLLKRVEALGGACGVTGRTDGGPGSLFWFSFPYRPDHLMVSSRSDINHHLNENNHKGAHALSLEQLTTLTTLAENQERGASFLQERGGYALPTTASKSGVPPSLNFSNRSSQHTSDQNITARSEKNTVQLTTSRGRNERKSFDKGKVVTTSAPSLNILLTDDAPTILKVAGRLLRTNGHSVITATNGSQSLDKLKTGYLNNDLDVLLTDLQMPVMDGIECTKRFRAWEEEQQRLLDAQCVIRRDRFLIVGMSANSDSETKQQALDAGMDLFCPKPFNYMDFETIILTRWGTKCMESISPATSRGVSLEKSPVIEEDREKRDRAQHDLELALKAKLQLSDASTREIRRSFEKDKSGKASYRAGGGVAGSGVSLPDNFGLSESSGGSPITTRNRREERAKKAAKTIDSNSRDSLHESISRTPRIEEEDLLVAEFSDQQEAENKSGVNTLNE